MDRFLGQLHATCWWLCIACNNIWDQKVALIDIATNAQKVRIFGGGRKYNEVGEYNEVKEMLCSLGCWDDATMLVLETISKDTDSLQRRWGQAAGPLDHFSHSVWCCQQSFKEIRKPVRFQASMMLR